MPPMPPIPISGAPPAGIGVSGSGFSVIAASVVKSNPEIDAAFSTATLATFAGSIIQALNILTYFSSLASNPKSSFPSRTF